MKNLNKILTKKFLKIEYLKSKKSSVKIAEEINCSKTSVLNYLKKYNIYRRTLAQAFKGIRKSLKTEFKKGNHPENEFKKGNKLNRGINNPMFGVYKYGKTAPNWKGGKSFESYPLGWTQMFKKQIRDRDEHKCQFCGCPEIDCNRKLSVHHIDYNKENLNPNNLISLCQSCHLKTNGNRDYWYAYFLFKYLEEI